MTTDWVGIGLTWFCFGGEIFLEFRLIKEEDSYKVEYDRQLERIKKVSEETPDDDWNIRKQKQVLDETIKMIPDVQQRLSQAVEELTELVDAHRDELAGTDELAKAEKVLSLAASRAAVEQN